MGLGGKVVAIGISQMMHATITSRAPSRRIAHRKPQSELLRSVYRVLTAPRFSDDILASLQKYCVNRTAKTVRTEKLKIVAVIVAPAVAWVCDGIPGSPSYFPLMKEDGQVSECDRESCSYIGEHGVQKMQQDTYLGHTAQSRKMAL